MKILEKADIGFCILNWRVFKTNHLLHVFSNKKDWTPFVIPKASFQPGVNIFFALGIQTLPNLGHCHRHCFHKGFWLWICRLIRSLININVVHCTKYPHIMTYHQISSSTIKYFYLLTTSLLLHCWSGGVHAIEPGQNTVTSTNTPYSIAISLCVPSWLTCNSTPSNFPQRMKKGVTNSFAHTATREWFRSPWTNCLWRLKWSSNPRRGINTWQPRPFQSNQWKLPIKWKSKPLYFHNISSQTINTNSHRICHMDLLRLRLPIFTDEDRSSSKVCLKTEQDSCLFCAGFLEFFS